MNDQDLDEILRGNVPAELPEARERARLRLRAAIVQEEAQRPPLRRRRLVALVAAAAAVVVGLLVLQVVLPPGSGGPGLSAAEEIRRLGRLSSAQELLLFGDNQYLYTDILQFGGQSPRDEGEYMLAVQSDIETWYGQDGSGARQTTIERVDFLSELDRESWLKAGSPPLPQPGPTKLEPAGPGEFVVYRVEDLPTDPKALRAALERGDVIPTGEGDVSLLKSIGILLSQMNVSGELRQALFDVAATIPSVTVQYGVEDHAGRPAVSLTATDESGDSTLFFDRSDAQLLGSSFELPAAAGRPVLTQWTVYLDSGVVSKIGERP